MVRRANVGFRSESNQPIHGKFVGFPAPGTLLCMKERGTIAGDSGGCVLGGWGARMRGVSSRINDGFLLGSQILNMGGMEGMALVELKNPTVLSPRP